MAGRYFTKMTGNAIPRITGLDPSRPCFSESDRPNGLQRGDALFVDIIHSDLAVWGLDPIGDIDFYPNGSVYHDCSMFFQLMSNNLQAQYNPTRLLVNCLWKKSRLSVLR